jgi:hypothetical protein
VIEEYDDLSFVVRLMPDACSCPAFAYAEEHLRLWRFETYIFAGGLTSTRSSSEVASVVPAEEGLRHILAISFPEKDVEQMVAATSHIFTPDMLAAIGAFVNIPSSQTLQTYAPTMFELIFCRMVDNYLIYLRDLLALIYQTRPEMLKSSEQVTYEFILQFSTMEDVITGLAEKRANELAYKGFREIVAFWNKHGLDLFSTSDGLESILRLVETRNILVHNRGIINSIFKKRVPNHLSKIGDRIKYGEEFYEDAEMLTTSVFDIDARAVNKFGLNLVLLRPTA